MLGTRWCRAGMHFWIALLPVLSLQAADDFTPGLVGEYYHFENGLSDLPALVEDTARLEPVYDKLPGWRAKTTGVTHYENLPSAAKDYVRFLERAAGAPAVFIATGPRREETIWRHDSPFLTALPSPGGRGSG